MLTLAPLNCTTQPTWLLRHASAAGNNHTPPSVNVSLRSRLNGDDVRAGFVRYDAGEIDAFGLDQLIHRYQIAARELWKFCSVSGGRVGTAVRMLELSQERGEMPDWWQAAERMRR